MHRLSIRGDRNNQFPVPIMIIVFVFSRRRWLPALKRIGTLLTQPATTAAAARIVSRERESSSVDEEYRRVETGHEMRLLSPDF